jgi:hypothetical protein
MTPSIELFLISSCLITIAISGWLANLLVDNSLARVISLRVSVKFKKNYKELESLCIDSRNTFLIYGGYLTLAGVAIFTYSDFGILYSLFIPVIAYLSILLSQRFVHQDTFAKERIDSLLENLLIKEKEFSSSSHTQLEIVQILCNYLISEFKYETHEQSISLSAEEQTENDAVGFKKTKHHLKNIGFELGSGLKILVIVIAIGLIGVGLKTISKEEKVPSKSIKLEEILKEHTLPEKK